MPVGGVEEGGIGQPGIRGIHSRASTSLVPQGPPLHTKRSPVCPPFPRPPAPFAAPAARPAGRLLLDAHCNSQPSETRRGPSGPSVPPRPHPALDEHSGRLPHSRVVRAGPQPSTPLHVSLRVTPAPKPHQFPAELAQEAVKPSAVHARAGAPARPASSSANSSGNGAERAGQARQRRPRPLPGSAAPRSP